MLTGEMLRMGLILLLAFGAAMLIVKLKML